MSNHPSQEHANLNPAVAEQDFIGLSKILGSLKRHWPMLLACIAAAMVCAAVLAKVLPARWQAETTLQIGKMPSGSAANGTQPTAFALIEPPGQAIERLKLRELQERVLTAAGFSTDEKLDVRTKLFKQTLKATPIKNSDFIQIRIAGFSRDEAQKNLTAVANALIASHNRLFFPTEKRLTMQLQDKRRQIAMAQAERARLEARLAGAGKSSSDTRFAPNIVALNLLDFKEAELHKLTTEQAWLEDVLAPAQTYPTAAIDAAHVGDTPYFPKLSLFLAAGAFLGLLLGLGVVLWRDRKHFKD